MNRRQDRGQLDDPGEPKPRSRWLPVQLAAMLVWVVLFYLSCTLGTQGLEDRGSRPRILSTLLVFFQIDHEHRDDPVWTYIGLAVSIPGFAGSLVLAWLLVRRRR
ncbi:MAG TPA: hypothetical protein VGC67_01355 [Cellulomonas sp.]